MQGERLPPFPADAKNILSLIEFVTDPKKCSDWMKQAGDVIKRNQALMTTIGKANEIDKLHAEAAELKRVVVASIDKREADLKTEQGKFDAERTNQRAMMKQQAAAAGDQQTVMKNEAARLRNEASAMYEAAETALSAASKAETDAENQRKQVSKLRDELAARATQAKRLAEAVA